MKKESTHISYRLWFLFVSLFLISKLLAQTSISGTVTSMSDNAPLPGATVMEKGSSNGTVTDLDGNFNITATEENATLVFSYVGYLSEEVVVDGQNSFVIKLAPDLMSLEQVVVTAYSEKTKTEISSAVVSLSSEEVNNVTVNNVEDMLVGMVAGVHVQSSSGQPGEASDIRIRGVGSIYSDQKPLIVVDGIIGGTYNPNDIESISVLKDAGATGLYGSAAAAGVILIKTKSGNFGKPEIRAAIRSGIKQPEFGNYRMMNSQELYDYHQDIISPATFPTVRPDSLLNTDYDWINNTYRQSNITSVNLSASGASQKTNYYISIDYLDDEGTLRGTSFDRISLRSNIKYQLSERLNIGTNFVLNTTNNSYAHWNMAEGAFRLHPWDSPTYSNGDLVYDVDDAGWLSNLVSNPYHSEQYNRLGGKGINGMANFTLDITLTDWLKIDSWTTLSAGYSKYEEIYSSKSYEGVTDNGVITNLVTLDQAIQNTTLLKFNKDFGSHGIDGLFGTEISSYQSERELGGTAVNFLDGKEIMGAAGSQVAPSGTKVELRGVSVLSQLNYNYAKKYFATVSYRRDGNSKFAPNNKYASFFTYAASWLISSEDFMKSIEPIHYAKVRASYGAVGNSSFPGDAYYPYFPSFTVSSSWSYNGQSAYVPYEPGNYNLTWETSKPLNLGLDLGFINRIELNFDYYDTRTEDVLFKDPMPSSQGYLSQWKNVGKIHNTGVEFAINAVAIQTSDITWNINFNIAANKNKLETLSSKEGVDEIVINRGSVSQILTINGGAFDWYMPKWLGVDPDNGQPLWEDILYDDNGNEIGREATSAYNELDVDDNQIMGSPFPDFTGGFGTFFSYKGISINATFVFSQGNMIYHTNRQESDNDGENINVNSMKLLDGWTRWENPGDNATHPEPIYGGNLSANQYSSRYLEDGSYLRIRNLTLAYDVPGQFVQKIKLNSLRVSLSMDNLKTWTKYSGMDPDVQLYPSDWLLPGQQSFKYPLNKQILFGLEISF